MENYFPVTHSTLAINALMTDVLPDYDIGVPLECRLLHLGLNDTYLVKTRDGQYILRVYREGWRSVSEILYELDVLLFLQRENHAVSVPLSRKDGSLIHPVTAPEGIRYVVLFTYAPGKEPMYEVPFSLSSPIAPQIGCMCKPWQRDYATVCSGCLLKRSKRVFAMATFMAGMLISPRITPSPFLTLTAAGGAGAPTISQCFVGEPGGKKRKRNDGLRFSVVTEASASIVSPFLRAAMVRSTVSER